MQEILRNLQFSSIFNMCKVAIVITMGEMQNRLSGVDNGIGLAGDPCAKTRAKIARFWNKKIWNIAAF